MVLSMFLYNVSFFHLLWWKSSPMYSFYFCNNFSFSIVIVSSLDFIHLAEEYIFCSVISFIFLYIFATFLFCCFSLSHCSFDCLHLFLLFFINLIYFTPFLGIICWLSLIRSWISFDQPLFLVFLFFGWFLFFCH